MSCWLCGSGREWLHTSLPTLYVDGVPIFEALGDATTSHGRILQGSDGGRSSKTCQVLGLSDTCCLTLVFAATPYMVGLFLIIKCHPRNALISVTVLALTTYFLSYVAWVEFLSCVVSLFIMNLCQLFATVGFLIRRRAVYKSGWLDKQPEDRENPIARVIENAMRAGRRDGSANPGSGIGEAVRASIRGGEVLASASGQSAQNRYSSTSSPACRGGRSPDHSQHRGARGMDGGGLGGRAASISESLSDMLFEIRDEMGSRTQAARQRRNEAARTRQRGGEELRPDPNDGNDPHNWSVGQLKAYLHTTAPAGAKELATSGSREVLVRRCCDVMGRRYYAPPGDEDEPLDIEEGSGANAATANDPHTPSQRPAGAPFGSSPQQPTMASQERLAQAERAAQRAAERAARRAEEKASAAAADAPPHMYDESFQRKALQRERMRRLFPFLDEAGVSDESFAERRSRAAGKAVSGARGQSAGFGRAGGTGTGTGSVRSGNACSGKHDEVDATDNDSSGCSSGGSSRGSGGGCSGAGQSSSSPQRIPRDSVHGRRPSTVSGAAGIPEPVGVAGAAGHKGGSMDDEPVASVASAASREEAAKERRSRREEAATRGEERRRESEQRRQRQRRTSASSTGADESTPGQVDVKAEAAHRVEQWATAKDFFAMLRTLDSFPDLSLHKSVGTSRGLERGAPAAALKKAFHRASLSLHPDRLVGLPSPRRAEAEEIFKVITAAYETERKRAEVSA